MTICIPAFFTPLKLAQLCSPSMSTIPEAAALRNARRAINQELHRKRQEARWKVSRELRAAAKEEMRLLKLEAARMDHKAQKQAELEERRKRAQNWRGFNGKPRANWRALPDDDEVS